MFRRIKNLWKLSGVQITPDGEFITAQDSPTIRVLPKGTFIPYNKRDPVKEITEQQP